MIQITSSPTYKKTYDTPTGPITFDYNVVGAQSTISYQFKDLQARLGNITQYQVWALLDLRENINDYLNSVVTLTGKDAQIYLEDKTPTGHNYTGTYRIATIQTNTDGNSRLLLKTLTGEAPTFYGVKSYEDNNDSQVIYKYRSVASFEVYNTTEVNGVTQNVLIQTNRAQLASNGYIFYNISEIAKGYLTDTGGISITVKVTISDYFNNASTITTDPCILTPARVPEQNYGLYTMYNPENKGEILPSTGYQLLYSDATVYPFYYNFVANNLMGKENITVKLKIEILNSTTLIDTVYVYIPPLIGLNIVDLSSFPELVTSIIKNKPSQIKITPSYFSLVSGEFTDQFNGEFLISTEQDSGIGADTYIPCTTYTLDNRRDFYFSYQNSIGGLSTYLCTEYTRSTEPEIVPLRNAETISNSVARETEYVNLTFKYANLRGLKFLLGYDTASVIKNDGVYESRTITRISSEGHKVLWIIKSNTYDLPNAALYKDINFTIYRPIGAQLK